MTTMSRMDANVPAPAQMQIVPPKPRADTTQGIVPPADQVAAPDNAARADAQPNESAAVRIESERRRAADVSMNTGASPLPGGGSAAMPIPTRQGVRFDDKINRFVIEVRDPASDRIIDEIPNRGEQRRIARVHEQIGRLLDDLA